MRGGGGGRDKEEEKGTEQESVTSTSGSVRLILEVRPRDGWEVDGDPTVGVRRTTINGAHCR